MRLPDFFQRMHAPALANTFGSWCVALASIVYFSCSSAPALHTVLIVILLAITAPVTTMLLARAALFRNRAVAGAKHQQDDGNRAA